MSFFSIRARKIIFIGQSQFTSFLHTPAQHPVRRDLVDKPDHVEGDQSLLRAIEGTLRIEDAQVAVDSLGITRMGEAVGFRNGVDQ